MFKLLKLVKPIDKVLITLLIFILSAQVYFDLFLPDRIQDILSLWKSGVPNAYQIWINFLYALGFVFGSFFCLCATMKLSSSISNDLAYEMRRKIFSHVNSLSTKEIDSIGVPSLINRNTGDVMKVARGLEFTLKLGIAAPGMMIGGIIKAVVDSSNTFASTFAVASFSLAIVFTLIILLIFLSVIGPIVISRMKKLAFFSDDLNEKARENITGVRVIRAFDAQKLHIASTDKISEKIYRNNFAFCFWDMAFSFIASLVNYVTITIYWIGAYFIFKGEAITIPVLIKFTLLSNIIIYAFVRSTMLIFFLPSAIVSAKRINQVLKLSSSIVSGKTKKINLKNKYAIEFTNVNFKVNSTSENILSNIDFKIKPGKTLAIIGATGSGKSMIAKLTARLFDSSKGTIKIYGRNIKEYDLNFLHETIGFAPQKAFLFNTTIHNNVLANIADRGYSAYLQDQIVKKACDIACASEFINKYEDKYNHIVSQNSTNLSGGQRQRIAIARAIAKEPNILIFDDSFSALDMLTDKKIRKNISNNYRKTTKIIIAQRINTIINADNIIVLDSGKIVGHGTHKSLMKSCKVYQEFAHSQLSRKELNNGK